MTATETVTQYGETVVTTGRTVAEQLRTPLLAAVGAGDLAAKEARALAQQVAAQARTATSPDVLIGTVSTLVDAARTQVGALAQHGAGVVDELRRRPAFRTVVRGAESAVDTVEDALEEVLEETAEAVSEASDEVTSVAQKTAAKAAKAAKKAEARVEDAAEQTKATVRSAEGTDPTAVPAKN